MKTKLLKGLDKQQQDDLRQNFVHSRLFRDRLVEVLTQEIENIHVSMRNTDVTEPNWALDQASKLAETKAMLKIISFIQ